MAIRSFRSLAAALLLAVAPQVALAAPPTAADLADFKAMTGLGRVMAIAAKSMSDTLPPGLDPAVHACLAKSIDSEFTATLDESLDAVLTHELADQWRAFAATGAGAKFMVILQDSWEGKALPDGATIKASMTDEEFQALGRFVQSPAYAVFRELRGRIAATDRGAIARNVMQACNVTG